MALFNELVKLASANALRLQDSDNSNYTGFVAPSAVTSNSVYEMPAAYPASIAFLKSSNSGVLTWDTNTYISGTPSNLTSANITVTGGTGAVLQAVTLLAQTADASTAGYVSTAAQTFAGNKTFNGSILKANNATNASFVSDVAPAAAGATAADAESATATFDSDYILFRLESVGTVRAGMLVATTYDGTAISSLSDPANLLLLSDAGVGYYISKSAASSDVVVKNRMGESVEVVVKAVGCQITAATAWA